MIRQVVGRDALIDPEMTGAVISGVPTTDQGRDR